MNRHQRRASASKEVELPESFVRGLVNTANNNEVVMDGTMTPVLEICSAAEIVYGIYQDSTVQFGVGLVVVKGENLLRECIASGNNIGCRMTAIKCICAEQAIALRDYLGADKVH